MSKARAVVMNSADNTATVVETISPETDVVLEINGQAQTVHVVEQIGFGHKFAIRDIAKGAKIIKYGEIIGTATQNIHTGQHVHVHNLESGRGRGDK